MRDALGALQELDVNQSVDVLTGVWRDQLKHGLSATSSGRLGEQARLHRDRAIQLV